MSHDELLEHRRAEHSSNSRDCFTQMCARTHVSDASNRAAQPRLIAAHAMRRSRTMLDHEADGGGASGGGTGGTLASAIAKNSRIRSAVVRA